VIIALKKFKHRYFLSFLLIIPINNSCLLHTSFPILKNVSNNTLSMVMISDFLKHHGYTIATQGVNQVSASKKIEPDSYTTIKIECFYHKIPRYHISFHKHSLLQDKYNNPQVFEHMTSADRLFTYLHNICKNDKKRTTR